VSELEAIIDAFEATLKLTSLVEGLVTDAERKTLEQRIARARAAIKDPINVAAGTAAMRSALERALRGEG